MTEPTPPADETGYLYIDDESGDIVGVSFGPDENFAQYTAVPIPKEELLFLVERPVPTETEGYIYYSPAEGEIKVVSMQPDEDAAKIFECLRAPREQIVKFLSGEWHVGEWTIGYPVTDRATLKLLPLTETRLLKKLRFYDDQWIEVQRRGDTVPVMLRIRASQIDKSFAFELDHLPNIEVETDVDILPFQIIQKGDPLTVFETFDLPVQELLKEGKLIIPVQTEISHNIGLVTKRFIDCSLDIIQCHTTLVPLPSGHFYDLERLQAEPAVEPSFVANVRNLTQKIQFELHGADPRMYHRDMHILPVLLTAPSDPTVILHGTEFSVDGLLRDGEVLVDLPEGLERRAFDMYVPLLFKDMGFRRQNLTKTMVPMLEGHFTDLKCLSGASENAPSFVAELDYRIKKMTLRFEGGDVRMYDRPLETMTVLLTPKDNPVLVFQVYEVDVADLLLNEAVTLLLPEDVIPGGVDVYTQLLFLDTAVREIR